MKIVNILGGLGNQMFEYAMYLALKEAHPDEEVLLCRRSYKGYHLHNGYELDRIFGIQAPEASLWQLAKVAYPFINYRTWQVMRHWLPVRKRTMTRGAINIPFDYYQVERIGSAYYDGYWQNEKNFLPIRQKIIDAFNFPSFIDSSNLELSKKIIDNISVSCHVRRGDYLKDPNMYVCTPDYYERAITFLCDREEPELFCIFSDDIPWCKQKLSKLIKAREIVFVDWNKGPNSYCDMHLMSLCKHNIIANSSFSWWGAWLNQYDNKVILAPRKWINGVAINDPLCESWIKIDIK